MIAHLTFQERLVQGTSREAVIAEAWAPQLAKYGATLAKVERDEDIKRKVDRWLTTAKGTRMGVQIKYRESGDDVLVELVRNIDGWIPGRDMVGIADLYFCVDRNGTGRMYQTKHIKPDAQKIIQMFEEDIKANPHVPWWYPDAPLDKWSVNVGVDKGDGHTKVRAFFQVDCYPHQKFLNL